MCAPYICIYICVYLHIMCTFTLKDKLQKLILFPECGNGIKCKSSCRLRSKHFTRWAILIAFNIYFCSHRPSSRPRKRCGSFFTDGTSTRAKRTCTPKTLQNFEISFPNMPLQFPETKILPIYQHRWKCIIIFKKNFANFRVPSMGFNLTFYEIYKYNLSVNTC